jgi:hypothetical protein
VGTIDTDAYSLRLRERAIDPLRKKILLTNFRGTAQESDLSEPANCEGYGRVRHFSRQSNSAWPANPLPIDPAAVALGLGHIDALRAQVFQNAACNWRCWYCFVPFPLLSANERYASWIDAATLIDLYAAQPSRSPMIDLTGGQPDLVPEWVPWMLDALADRGIDESVYVWSEVIRRESCLPTHRGMDGFAVSKGSTRHPSRLTPMPPLISSTVSSIYSIAS